MRYASASVVALLVDMLAFFLLIQAGITAILASGAGYCTGIVAHWLFSSRLVFRAGTAPRGGGRLRQKSLFVGTALIGLALTMAIVGLGEAAGLAPFAAKCVAVIVSFQTTYLVRKSFVFTL
jgi:putative flippase GtrA